MRMSEWISRYKYWHSGEEKSVRCRSREWRATVECYIRHSGFVNCSFTTNTRYRHYAGFHVPSVLLSKNRAVAQIMQITQEQLQQLIEAVRTSAVAGAANAATAGSAKSKASFAKCLTGFNGERDHDIVEEFISTVTTYKEIESISDEDAIKGISLLFQGPASTWWQGVRKEVKTWNDVISMIREYFSPTKAAYQIYMEIFENTQKKHTPIDTFVCQQRALLAQLPDGRHDEETQLDLVYGLLNIKYRQYIARHDVKTFKELLEQGRIIEQYNMELKKLEEERNPTRKAKRCNYCTFRGHTNEECRKRKAHKEMRLSHET